jgi:hypothetical protein
MDGVLHTLYLIKPFVVLLKIYNLSIKKYKKMQPHTLSSYCFFS